MWIAWATRDPKSQQDNVVNFGTSAGSLNSVAKGTSVTYSFKKTPSYTAPFTHHVLLEKLAENTTYYYEVGGPACGYSSVLSFNSHPGVSVPMHFAIMGDLGQTANSNDTLQHIAANPAVQAIVHVSAVRHRKGRTLEVIGVTPVTL